MRERMRTEHTAASNQAVDFDLKRDPGGIVDIEFGIALIAMKMISRFEEEFHRSKPLVRVEDNVWLQSFQMEQE